MIRGGRDGKIMMAKLLNVSKFNRFCDKDMLKYTSFKTVI